MKIHTYDSEAEWLEDRKTRIMGTKLKGIGSKRGGTDKKIGFYQLIADRLAIDEEGDEDPMDRGHRLEKIATELLSKHTGFNFIQVDREIWESEDHPSIAFSPDEKTKDLKKAGETKALKSSEHIQAWHKSLKKDLTILQRLPSEYREQYIQAFIVNKKLETLYPNFIDPRVEAMPFFYLEIHRKDIEKEIEKYKELQLKELQEVDDLVAQLAF